MKTKRAFTKTDLVFAVSCVIFLLINLGTIGSSGQETAKESVCLSNLRQWGQCFSLYTADNSGHFDSGGSGPDEKWANSLHPYYKQGNLRLCPTATKLWWENGGPYEYGHFDNNPEQPFAAWGKYRPPEEGEELRWDRNSRCLYGSYGSNSWIYNYLGAHRQNSFWRTINVSGGDKVPMLLDGLHIGGRPDTTDDLPDFNGNCNKMGSLGSASNAMSRFMMDRHSGGIQAVFMDLSVRKIGVKGVGRLKWHRVYDEDFFGPTFIHWPSWIKPYPYE